MTMDWESWLREESNPPSKQDDPHDIQIGASQAELLGLPVVLPEKTGAGSVASTANEPLFSAPQSLEPLERFSPEMDLPVVRNEPRSLPVTPETPLHHVQAPVSQGERAKQRMPESGEPVFNDFDTLFASGDVRASTADQDAFPKNGTSPRLFREEPDPGFVSEKSPLDELNDLEENGEHVLRVSTFTIPSEPLYPIPVSSSVPEKARVADEEGSVKKSKAAPVLFLTAFLMLGGLLYYAAEPFDAVLKKAEQAYELKEYDKAVTYYDKASEKEPLRIEPFRGKALALEAMDRKGEAVDAWISCLQVAAADQEKADVFDRLGTLFFRMGSLDNALRNYQESIRFNPDNAEVYFHLGEVYEAREDFAEAVDAYRKAMEIEPSRAEFESAVKRAGEEMIVREEERSRRAELAGEQVLLGAASLVAGEYEDAEAHFLRALDLTPNEENALLGLLESRVGKGDIDGARSAYAKLRAFERTSEKTVAALSALETILAIPQTTPSHAEARAGEELSAERSESGDVETAGTPDSVPVHTEISVASEDAAGKRLASLPKDPEHGEPTPAEKTTAGSAGSGPLLPEAAFAPSPTPSESEEYPAPLKETPPSAEMPPVSSEPTPTASLTPTPSTKIGKEAALLVQKTPAIAKRESLVQKSEPMHEPRNGRIVRATPPAPKTSPRQKSPKTPELRGAVPAALRRNEEKALAASRSMNLSREYSKAAEKASEALRIQQSPEALSNLGFANIGLGNYPAAFTAYWRRLLLSRKVQKTTLEPPAFLSMPFESARWKEIPSPDPRDVPLSPRAEAIILLPGVHSGVPSRVVAGKEYLFEALRINPVDRDVYLNLVLSYILMQDQQPPSPKENDNENALYLALLGHALRVRNENGLSAHYFDAALARASGEVLRLVRSLEAPKSAGKK